MKKLYIALFYSFLFILNNVNSFSQCISCDVHACIDVIDYLHVQGNQMWWVHQGGSNPGQHSSCSGDVLSVNGTPWGAWSNPFILAGVTSCMDVTSTVTQCSNSCSLIQAPSGNNGWETIYKFDDSGPSAAHNYKILFTFCPFTPTSTFSVSSPACAGNDVTITYTDTATDTAAYNWNFDGATIVSGSGKGPYIVNWPAPGNYNVTLDVTECSSTSSTTTVPVTVAISPSSAFNTISPVCKDSISVITYTGNGSGSANYNWNFDGGNIISGTGQGPYMVSWPVAGTKNITLQVDENGCLSPVTTDTITIIAPPTSTFTASAPVCQGDMATIAYTGNALASASYNWNFDGGTIVSGSTQGPYSIHWSSSGTKNISLIVTENSCPSLITTVQQMVEPLPSANFIFSDVCLNETMFFNDSSIASGTPIASWSWNFGDNSPVNNNQNPSYTYSNNATYSVSLLVTDSSGCKNAVTKTVIVHPLPTAIVSTSNVCHGSTAQFNSQSVITTPDSIILSLWDFGDGNTSGGTSVAHLYSAAGSYSVKLLVTSNAGCPDSVTAVFVVNPNPSVAFISSDTVGCTPLCISFQDSTPGSNIQWVWQTGDGTTVNNSQNFNHCYTNDSVFSQVFYSPGITVTSDSGCISALTKNNYIAVYPNPLAGFIAQPDTEPYTTPIISLTDLSIGTTSWKWNFGDLQTDSSSTPLPHFYADTGTYTITLISSNSYNCKDTAYQTVSIEPDFVFYIPNAFTPDEDGINDTFSAKGTFVSSYEMRIFDRWGNMVFFSDSLDKPWGGKIINSETTAQRDVYIYSIMVTDIKNRKHNYKGLVSLIR